MAGTHLAAAEAAVAPTDCLAVAAVVVVAPSGCQINVVAVVDKVVAAVVAARAVLAAMMVVPPSASFCQMWLILRLKMYLFEPVTAAKVVQAVAADLVALADLAAALEAVVVAGWSVKVVQAAMVVMVVQAAAVSRVAVVGR